MLKRYNKGIFYTIFPNFLLVICYGLYITHVCVYIEKVDVSHTVYNRIASSSMVRVVCIQFPWLE